MDALRVMFVGALIGTALLFAGGCCDSTDTNATTQNTDAKSAENSGCSAVENGAACAAGATCEDTSLWCGQPSTDRSCSCKELVWECSAPRVAAPPLCHTCCQEIAGPSWFCLSGGCVQALGCQEPDCCIPGPAGDTSCQAAYGDASVCTPAAGDGHCTQP